MLDASDERWMRRALDLAREAQNAGEVPVGAVLVVDGRSIGEGRNQPIERSDPTGHAEIVALRAACSRAGNYRLPEATLYVTLEPCPMCAGALVHARVRRIVYAAPDPRAGACGSVFNVAANGALNHRISLSGGLFADQAGGLLRSFFRDRRRERLPDTEVSIEQS